jgi:tRNA (guanine-N7-)-methyltransferase
MRSSPPIGRVYGRRRGRTLKGKASELYETGLEALTVKLPAPDTELDPASVFAVAPAGIWLEIGFGGGEHLAAQAAQHPDIGFIGCEPFINGVAKALAGIEEEKLSNIRLRAGDAGELIAALPDAALSRIFILYPDPWPKRRQQKRRLIDEETIAELARVARPGAELRFATDIDDYAGWTLRRFLASPDFAWTASRAEDWRIPWAGWAATRYEAKARAAGRPSAYLTFRRH